MHNDAGYGNLKLQSCGNSRDQQYTLHKSTTTSGTKESPRMDSPLVTQVFRRLLSHQTCSRLHFYPALSRSSPQNAPGRRCYRSSSEDEVEDHGQTSSWQQRTDIFPPDKLREYERYPMVTADALRNRRERPKRVKMLARDFIDGNWPIEPSNPLANIMARQSLQSSLRLLSQTSRNIQPWATF